MYRLPLTKKQIFDLYNTEYSRFLKISVLEEKYGKEWYNNEQCWEDISYSIDHFWYVLKREGKEELVLRLIAEYIPDYWNIIVSVWGRG